MALAIADRVKETTTSTGTGTINLAGASTGFQTFVAGIGDGNTCYYAIEDANGSAWEVGIGTVTDASPDTLARTTVLKSTNSNNAITLTSGTHTVFATYPSDKAVFKDESGIVLASGIQVGASGLLLDGVTITTLQIHSESFADNDTSLMTSKAIADKIEDYGYSTTAGDITAVVAGSGISGGATTGSATVTLDLNGLASGVVADNDYLVFVDVNDSNSGKKESLGDIAGLFAGTNLTAANSVISVDDAFLVNDASDTTTGTITAGGFTTTGTWTMDTSAGGTAGITNINVTDTFTDDDVTIMSAGAIKEKIESYSYTTNAGDITAVVAGSGMSGGATSSSATVTLDLNGLASGVVADNDYLVFVDVNDSNSGKKENLSDIAALFAGTNLTAANSVISVDDAFLKNDASDTTTGTITAGGFTTTGTWTFDTSAGGTTGITNINVGSAFTDDDVTLMSAGAIKEKIESYSYTTNAGDITAVVAGSGMSGGDTSGSATVTLDLNGLASGVVADNDYLVFVDVNDSNSGKKENLGDIAALFAGTNLTATNSVIAVDDAFLKNDASDTTTGTITAAGFTTTGNVNAKDGNFKELDSWVYSSGVTVGASGVVMKDADLSHSITVKAPEVVSTSFTFLLPSGDGSNGQVLTTDSKNTYWSTSSGGVSGDTFATDLKIGRDSDNLIDFATTDNKIILRANGNDEVELVENALSPVANDGVALGTGSLMWSDLFLASAGVINFNNGDVTLTHSSNNLTIAGGTLTTAGIIRGVTTKVDTDDYTPTASDHIILVDTTNGDRDINLPAAAATNIGQEYTIKKIDSGTGKVYIKPNTTGGYGPDDIDEYDTKYVLYVQHDTVTFVCGPGDASATDEQWWVIAEKVAPHCAKLEQQSSQDLDQSRETIAMTHTIFSIGCLVEDPTNDYIQITRPGKYLAGGHLRVDEMTHESKEVYLELQYYDASADATVQQATVNNTPSRTDQPGLTTETVFDLESGDQVKLVGKHTDSSSTVPTVASNDYDRAFLWVQEIK